MVVAAVRPPLLTSALSRSLSQFLRPSSLDADAGLT